VDDGHVFIATSVTLFGLSYYQSPRFGEVLLMGVFSVVLFLVWLTYVAHVQPYIDISLRRLPEIERVLQGLGYLDIPRLHTEIRAGTGVRRRGKWITRWLFFLVLFAWSVRVLFLTSLIWAEILGWIVVGIIIGVTVSLFFLIRKDDP
jgi:hypothetical protein